MHFFGAWARQAVACARLSEYSADVLKRAKSENKTRPTVSPQPPHVFRISFYWATFHLYLGAWNRLDKPWSIESKAVVYELTKRTQEMQFADWAHQSSIRLTVWKWSGESLYPGAFSPVLEKFCRAFIFSRPVRPWVSEDEPTKRYTWDLY